MGHELNNGTILVACPACGRTFLSLEQPAASQEVCPYCSIAAVPSAFHRVSPRPIRAAEIASRETPLPQVPSPPQRPTAPVQAVSPVAAAARPVAAPAPAHLHPTIPLDSPIGRFLKDQFRVEPPPVAPVTAPVNGTVVTPLDGVRTTAPAPVVSNVAPRIAPANPVLARDGENGVAAPAARNGSSAHPVLQPNGAETASPPVWPGLGATSASVDRLGTPPRSKLSPLAGRRKPRSRGPKKSLAAGLWTLGLAVVIAAATITWLWWQDPPGFFRGWQRFLGSGQEVPVAGAPAPVHSGVPREMEAPHEEIRRAQPAAPEAR